MPFSRKHIAWGLGTGLPLALLLVLLALTAPRLLNLDQTRRYLAARLQQTLGCELNYDTIELTLLPTPSATIHQGSAAVAGRFHATWEELKVRPRLLPLLLGEVRIAALELRSPEIHVHQPPPSADAAGTTPGLPAIPLPATDEPLQLKVIDGTLHLQGADRQPLTCRRLNGRLDLDRTGLRAELASFGDSWEELHLGVSWDPGKDHGTAQLEVAGLHPEQLAPVISPGLAKVLGDSLVTGQAQVTWTGSSDWSATVSGSLPRLSINNDNNVVVLQGRDFSGTIRKTADATAFELERLVLTEPAAAFAGHFKLSTESPRLQLAITATELDLDGVRPVALRLFSQQRTAHEIFDVLRGGTVATVTFAGQADSGEELGDRHHFQITGRAAGVAIHVPDVDLDLEEVVGDVTVRDGILTGTDLKGRMGKSSADSGRLVLDLAEKTGPFALDVQLDADLLKLPEVLARLVKNPTFVREMGLIKRLEGRAKGRLQIGERRNAIEVQVTARDLRAALNTERIPHPLRVDGGIFRYEKNHITLEHLRATVGATAVSELAAEINWNGSVQLKCRLGQARVDLPEVFSWLVSYPTIQAKLKTFRAFRGQAELSALELEGPAEHPDRWRFRVAGEVRQFAMEAAFLPGPLSTGKGRFSADPETLSFDADEAALLDTGGALSGQVSGYLKGVSALELRFGGTLKPQTYKWTVGLFNSPEQLTLRAPFLVSKSVLIWEPAGKVALTASLAFPNGPNADIVLSAAGRTLKIDQLVLIDADSQLKASLNQGPEALEVRFNGKLGGATLDRILVRNDFLSGSVQGVFSLKLPHGNWAGFHADGTLDGSGVNKPWSLAWERRWPFTLESIALKADGDQVRITSAALDWNGAPIAVTGLIRFLDHLFTYELDIKAGELSWQQLRELVHADQPTAGTDPERASRPSNGADKPIVRGTIQLRSDRFLYQSLVWEPFSAALTVRGETVDFRITEARTCGVEVAGSGTLAADDFALALNAKTRQQLLDPTLACFWNKPDMIDGRYDLAAVLQAFGKPDQFWRGLSGNLNFTAQNGRIYRFTLLSKIFAVLNLTEMLKGRIPDLLHEGFAYNSFILNGPIRSGQLYVEQGYLDGASMGIAWEGQCDLANKTVDLVVLVAPFKTVDSILKNIPLVNKWFQGTLVSIPIKVTGPIDNPNVVPLPPSEVGKGILGFVERTLKLPLTIIQPLLP